jgi:hypothetical protein
MKTVQLSELEEQLFLAENQALAVQHKGKLVGYFYPIPQDQTEVNAIWERLEKAIERVMEETGLDEEELVAALAPKKHQEP